MSLVLKSGAASSNPSLEYPARDPLLKNSNNGVRFLADLAFGFSYPGGPRETRPVPAPPVDGQAVYDIAERANAEVELLAGSSIGYAGGGFDFTGVAAPGNYVRVPASVAADLFAEQLYLAAVYVKLPTTAEWATLVANANFFSWFTATTSGEANIVDVCQYGLGANSLGAIRAFRQNALGSTDAALVASMTAGMPGSFAQVAFWRTASQTGLRVKTAAGTVLVTGAAGAKNTANFSAKEGQFGITKTGWATVGGVFQGSHATAHNWRLYRMFVENLARSGRDPAAVLDADWARTLARGVFS